MADAGRKRLPRGMKVVDGSGRPNKDNRGERRRGDLPEPPDHLGEIARNFWYEAAETLNEMGVGTEGDRWSLESMAMLYEGMRQAYEAVKENGITIFHEKKGVEVKNPALTTLQQNIKELRMQYNECGLTPSARAKLMDGEDGVDENPFAEF